jgi:hypothetical protein
MRQRLHVVSPTHSGSLVSPIAERAAEVSAANDLTAQAHLVAARAAHLRGDVAATSRNCQLAASLTSVAQTRGSALWIEFLNAFEVQDPSVRNVLELLRRCGDETPAHTLRLFQASAFLALEVDADVTGAQSANSSLPAACYRMFLTHWAARPS